MCVNMHKQLSCVTRCLCLMTAVLTYKISLESDQR